MKTRDFEFESFETTRQKNCRFSLPVRNLCEIWLRASIFHFFTIFPLHIIQFKLLSFSCVDQVRAGVPAEQGGEWSAESETAGSLPADSNQRVVFGGQGVPVGAEANLVCQACDPQLHLQRLRSSKSESEAQSRRRGSSSYRQQKEAGDC